MSSAVLRAALSSSYASNLLSKVPQAVTTTSARFITSREWRQKNGLFRARLSELPDWSYTDGRGYGPPSVAQKKRYLVNQELGQTVVRRMKELNEAKKFK